MSIEGDSYLKGLRLMNQDGDTIVESSNSIEEDNWLDEHELEEDQQIVGIKANTQSKYLRSVAFVLSKVGN